MYCIHNGETAIMMYNTETGKWVYIPEDEWYRMNDTDKSKYSKERT